MSESKHTPGAWTVWQDGIVRAPHPTRPGVSVVVARTDSVWTDDSGSDEERIRNAYAEQDANAALIARAPDLLREVEALRAQNAEMLEALETCLASLETMPLDNEDVEYLGAVRSLLAKAKGGDS